MSSQPSTSLPLHLLLPLSSGIVYVVGALLLKRAAELGADMWRTVRVCNFTTALMFAPLTLLGGTIPSWQLCWQPALIALMFVAGQIASLLALKIGDVSIATPVLGVKVLLVALLTTALIGEGIGAGLWTAALLSSAALALLNFSRSHSHHRVGATIFMATLAASAYAFVDVLVQKWSPAWGAGRLLPIMMGFAAAMSPALRPPRGSRESPIGRTPAVPVGGWVAGGAACFALQAIMIVSSIALYGQATVANVLYSSRGLWSVLAVGLVGHWFSNRERHLGARVLAWRFVGAALLLVAILIVLLDSHHNVRSHAGPASH
jgi:drug/metabolite transporter (DMT)-like permease